jgi:hypothetical protein
MRMDTTAFHVLVIVDIGDDPSGEESLSQEPSVRISWQFAINISSAKLKWITS